MKYDTAVRCSSSAKEAAKRAKNDGETWDDYLLRCADEAAVDRELDIETARMAVREEIRDVVVDLNRNSVR